MDSATASDTIELGGGVFSGPGNRDVYVAKALIIRSGSGIAENCVIDCGGSEAESHRGFEIAADCEFHGLTVANGFVPGRGGAVYAFDGTGARILDCVFVDNAAGSGGALGFDSLDRAAGRSPAVLPMVLVENTTFLRNRAVTDCGAAYFLAIYIDFVKCRFLGNSAAVVGGVTSFVHAGPTFTDCLFVGNYAFTGGAVECGDPADFLRCTFVANSALHGAHIQSSNLQGPSTIANSIFAFGQGDEAIECSQPWDVDLTCSDLFGNEGGDFVGCLESREGVDGNFSADPLFCAAAAGNYTLRDDSPCAAAHSGACGLIGALDVGCSATSVAEPGEGRTWASIKGLYRAR